MIYDPENTAKQLFLLWKANGWTLLLKMNFNLGLFKHAQKVICSCKKKQNNLPPINSNNTAVHHG